MKNTVWHIYVMDFSDGKLHRYTISGNDDEAIQKALNDNEHRAAECEYMVVNAADDNGVIIH